MAAWEAFATSATRTIASQTVGIGARVLINGGGSAVIGGYTQVVRNAINGECLGDNVLRSTLLSGAFGAAASVVSDSS